MLSISNSVQIKGNNVQKSTRKKKRDTEHLNPEQLVAWEKYRSGQTQNQIAESLGVHRVTVGRWVKNIPEYMKECPEYREALPRIASLVPHALNVYEFHVKGLASLQASKDVLKMAGLYFEHVFNETGEGKASLTEAEIRGKIKELAAQDTQLMDKMTGKQVQNSKEGVYLDNSVKPESKEWR